jgi:hypothetical protein
MEGLEDSNQITKENVFNRQQEIIVNGKKFEFNQNDPIFSISESQLSIYQTERSSKSKKVKVIPILNQPCFGCEKLLNKNVKQDICHFCTE